MGVVIRQSLYSSISAYTGVLIGFANAIIFMPKFMTPDEIGLSRTILGAGLLMANFGRLGMPQAMVRFNAIVEKHGIDRSKLYGLGVKGILLGSILFIGLIYLFRPQFFGFYEEKAPEINDYFLLFVILTVEMVAFQFLQSLASINLNIFTSNALKDTLYKILNLLGILLFGIGWISFSTYVQLHGLFYLILVIIMFIESVLKYRISFSFKSINKGLTMDILKFSSIAIITSFGGSMLTMADQQLITKYLGLDQNGIYTTAIFMITVIELPKRFVGEISAPLISTAFASHDYKTINDHYKKASINLFLLGGTLLLLLYCNLENVYQIMPNGDKYRPGAIVVIVAGLAKLTLMLFSLNDGIIAMSKYYKYNTLLIVFSSIMLIGLNVYLLPIYGLAGAAFTFLAVTLIQNVIKLIFLRVSYSFFPFTYKTLLAMGMFVTLLWLNTKIPTIDNPILDTAIRSSILGGILVIGTYVLGLSAEINGIINMIVNRIKAFLSR